MTATARRDSLPAERLLEFAETHPTHPDAGTLIELAGKWKHGWIPLDAIAAAIKAKRMKGDGIRRPGANLGAVRPSSKSRFDVAGARQHAALTAGARGKAKPRTSAGARATAPSAETPDQVRARAAEAVRLPRGELTTRANAGDRVARAELDRRAAKKGTPEHIRKMDVRQLREELTGKSDTPASERPTLAEAVARPSSQSRQHVHVSDMTDAEVEALANAHNLGTGNVYQAMEGHKAAAAAELERRKRANAPASERPRDRAAEYEKSAAAARKYTVDAEAGTGSHGSAQGAHIAAAMAAKNAGQHDAAAEHLRVAALHKAASDHQQARAAAPGPIVPPAAEAPSPASAAKPRKPSALHAEYRELKRQQDLRVESATRGALHAGVGGGSKKDSEEVLAYFGEGEHMGNGVEERLTYRKFLEQRRAGSAHEKQQQAAYDAAVKLGRKHSAEASGPHHDAEYAALEAQHGSDTHDSFAGGYGDGIIAGESAKAKRESAKAYRSARGKADTASKAAERPHRLQAERHKAAAAAHVEAGRVALDAGDRNTAQHHLAQAQSHVARASASLDAREAEMRTRGYGGMSTRELRVRGLEAKLGDRITVQRSAGRTTTAAERSQERIDRANANVERNTAAAERAATESDVRYGRARQIGDMIPMGQPILVGHHSERRHRKDLERIDTNMRASIEAQREAEHRQERARSAAARAARETDPRAAARRLKVKEAALRKTERILNGTQDSSPPASGSYKERLEAHAAELRDEIAHDRSIAGDLVAEGDAARFGKHNITPGDVVQIRGSNYVVQSTGPKNVKVMTEVGPLPYPYDQIKALGKLDASPTDKLKKLLARNAELTGFGAGGARKLPPAVISRIEAILRERGEG